MKTRFLIIATIVAAWAFIMFEFELTPSISQSSSPVPVSYADTIFESCYDDDKCTIDMLYEISQEESSQDDMLTTIDDLVDLYSDADFYCHPISHHLGEFLYGYVNRDLKTASDISDSRCAYGIMHGLVENTIQIENLLDGKPIESVDIKESCRTVEESLGDRAKKECIHGMGHSLIKIHDYNTVQAIEKCSEFDNWREVYMCNGGLFMQNIAEYAENRGGDFDGIDIYHPCNKIDGTENEEAATLCYRYQANYFLIQSGYDLQGASSLCKGISDDRYISVCYKGIAAHMAKDNFDDVDKTQLLCLSVPLEYQDACMIGAVESLTRFVSEKNAHEFCDTFDEKKQERCQERIYSLSGN